MKNKIKAAMITLGSVLAATFLVIGLVYLMVVIGHVAGAVLMIAFILTFIILFYLDILDSLNHPEGKIYQKEED